MEELEQGSLQPSMKHPETDKLPGSNLRAIATAYAFYYSEALHGWPSAFGHHT
jgi:hypothetical protein